MHLYIYMHPFIYKNQVCQINANNMNSIFIALEAGVISGQLVMLTVKKAAHCNQEPPSMLLPALGGGYMRCYLR